MKDCFNKWLPDIYPCDNCEFGKECKQNALARAEYADKSQNFHRINSPNR